MKKQEEPSPVCVRFEPSGVEVHTRRGRRIYDIAREVGMPLAQACDGEGICARCGVHILSGAEHLTRESPLEQRRKAANRVAPYLRLACLTAITGDVRVTTSYWSVHTRRTPPK